MTINSDPGHTRGLIFDVAPADGGPQQQFDSASEGRRAGRVRIEKVFRARTLIRTCVDALTYNDRWRAAQRRRFVRRVTKVSRARLAHFRRIRTIAPNCKQEIAAEVRRSTVRIVCEDDRRISIDAILVTLPGFALLATTYAVPAMRDASLSDYKQILLITPAVIAILAVSVVSLLLSVRRKKGAAPDMLGWSLLLSGPPAILYSISRFFSAVPPTVLMDAAVCAVSGVAAAGVALLIGGAFKRASIRSHAEAYLLYDLLALTLAAEAPQREWNRLRFRQALISRTDRIAERLLVGLDAGPSSGQIRPSWLAAEASAIAAGLRAWHKELLTPGPSTRRRFLDKFAACSVAVARGDWSTLDRVVPEARDKPWYSYVGTGLRVMIVAVLPAAIFLALNVTPHALQPPVADYAKVGAVLWIVLTILAALDQSFGSKLAALKDVSALLSQSRGGKQP